MEVLGGNQWGEVYELMTEKEVVVVGGGALTVGAAGGFLQGGGHSANSPKLGLAVDNLLEADIVIADGTLLTINKCWHTDLFWAIRGGGGGTFGIVTRAVYKAHEKEPNYFRFAATLLGNMTNDMCPDCKEKVLGAYVDWMDWTNTNQPGSWAGYNNWKTIEVEGAKYVVIDFSLLFFGDQTDAQRAIDLFDNLVDESNGEIVWLGKIEENYDNFYGWHGPTTDVVGASSFIASRLLQPYSLETAESKSALVDAIIASQGGVFEHIGGKGVIEGDPFNETSINPALRTALSIYGVTGGLPTL